jgi:hypothetical protein
MDRRVDEMGERTSNYIVDGAPVRVTQLSDCCSVVVVFESGTVTCCGIDLFSGYLLFLKLC